MEKVKLNSKTEINLPKLLESRLLIQANSGGGKSWAIRRLLEQSHGKVQQIILDPEGEFSTLREKFDYILCGKDGDVPAEARSASLLARKLLELNVSAIVDLYELPPHERKRFVRLFLEAMVNAPKELWHDCLIVIDEAHVFCPEKGESEASGAVIDLATRGRKRGFCAVLATQRISKLHKDAAAECNNKLIGRCVQDIDRKRSGEELGFTSKDEILSLRSLDSGEFYAFGPAISNEVIKVKVGDVSTSHPKVGFRASARAVPPTEKIKKVLSKLVDLPQEAAKELQTTQELKGEISRLKGELTVAQRSQKSDPKAIENAVKQALTANDRKWQVVVKAWKSFATRMMAGIEIFKQMDISKIPADAPSDLPITQEYRTEKPVVKPQFMPRNPQVYSDMQEESHEKVTGGALRMLKVLASRYPTRLSKSQLATFAKLKSSSGTYGTYLSILRRNGFIEDDGELFMATQSGIEYCGESPSAPQTKEEIIEMWRNNINGGARRMFDVLVEIAPDSISKEELGVRAGLEPSSGTFGTYLSILRSNNLIESNASGFRISREIEQS